MSLNRKAKGGDMERRDFDNQVRRLADVFGDTQQLKTRMGTVWKVGKSYQESTFASFVTEVINEHSRLPTVSEMLRVLKATAMHLGDLLVDPHNATRKHLKERQNQPYELCRICYNAGIIGAVKRGDKFNAPVDFVCYCESGYYYGSLPEGKFLPKWTPSTIETFDHLMSGTFKQTLTDNIGSQVKTEKKTELQETVEGFLNLSEEDKIRFLQKGANDLNAESYT